MSKRDDLENEARGEIGLFGAFGALVLGAGIVVFNEVNKSNEKDKLKIQIDGKYAEISSIERQIGEEEGKFFFVRDDSKISSLKQKRNQLIKENKDLVARYNKL